MPVNFQSAATHEYPAPTVVVPFVRVDTLDSPNVRGESRTSPADAYYRAIIVCLSSVRRWNPKIELILLTNSEPPTNYVRELGQIGASCRTIPFLHSPPTGYADRFVTSFYLLDALQLAIDSETTLFLDPDVVCIRAVDRLAGTVGSSVGALPIDYPPDYDISGLSRRGASELHKLLGEPVDLPIHYGGECYLIPRSAVERLARRAEQAWALSLERFGQGGTRFTTEEHVMGFALRGSDIKPLSNEIRRIWTATRHRTVAGDEGELSFWHLPAEKGRGFDLLYSECLESTGWFWEADVAEWVDGVGRIMGLHDRSPARFSRDTAGRAVGLVQSQFRRLRA